MTDQTPAAGRGHGAHPAMSAADGYTGVENLESMTHAVRYLRFLNNRIVQAAGGLSRGARLLDFGAGAGTHARVIRGRGFQVTCVEIDAGLRRRLADQGFVTVARVEDLDEQEFDGAYTMNVLEHIADDQTALTGLFSRIRPGGILVVYVPAFTLLFSSMDKKVGHVRRYRRANLMHRVRNAGFEIRSCEYVDSMGFVVTLLYKLVGGRSGDVSPRSIGIFDRFVFPVSRVVDVVTHRIFGKNVLLVARRPGGKK